MTNLAVIIVSALGQLALVGMEILQRGNLSTASGFKAYNMWNTLLLSMQEFTDVIAACLLATLQVVGILAWYLTLAGWEIMPFFVYGFFPVCAAVVPAIVQVTFVPFTKLWDGSKEWIKSMKLAPLSMRVGERKFVMKKLYTLRPLSVYAGILDHRFFPLSKSTKKRFIEEMISFTIEVLLAAPSLSKY